MKLDDGAKVVVILVGGKEESFGTLREGLMFCWQYLEQVSSLSCDGTKIDLSGGIQWKKE